MLPSDHEVEPSENQNTFDDEVDELAYLLFFKTCIVERQIDELQLKLKKSNGIRESLIKKRNTEFHKTFPFYFIEPSLVHNPILNVIFKLQSIDFTISFQTDFI